MRAATIVGILLVLLGIAVLVFGGFSFTQEETVLQLGPVDVEAAERETVPLPPILGAISLVGGIVLIAMGSRKG
ncbi:MAG TPA: hypothetical protein VF168_00840 [Trueperaceae bacterium]